MRKGLLLITLLLIGSSGLAQQPVTQAGSGDSTATGQKVAPFVPSAAGVVGQMLDLAQVAPGDYVIDLGSGDGQIVIAAAKRGALGHGVDLDKALIERSYSNARDAGVAERTAFLNEDIFKTDFSRATVVTLYLMPAANERLRPILLEKLEPGTRVVSNAFDMKDWKSDEYQVGSAGSGIYLWIIPEQAAGDWRFTVDGKPWQLSIEQEYQMITPQLRQGQTKLTIDKALLRGKHLQLIASQGEQRYAFHGEIDGDQLTGYIQSGGRDGAQVRTWTAERQSGR